MTRLLVAAAFLAGVVAGCTGLPALRTHAQSAEVAATLAALDAASARYGLHPPFLRCLAHAESRYQPLAYNRAGYHGLLQFSVRTWAWAAPAAGWGPSASPYDPVAAADVAAWLIAGGGVGHWPPARWCGRVWA